MTCMEQDDEAADDLRRMRAVSHPARWRVLTELWAGRTLTGTQAARLVGLSPSAMSYHLRLLNRVGLVEQVPSSDGREHPWRASTDGLRMTAQPDEALGGAMMRNVRQDVDRLLLAGPPEPGDRRPWPAGFLQHSLRMTREEASRLHGEVDALVERFSQRTSGRTAPGEPPGGEPEAGAFTYDVVWIQAARASDGGADGDRE